MLGEPQSAATAVEMVLARLKEDIFAGAIPPAAKLKVKDLTARYGVGATPIREALSHLAATGVIKQHSQRGFRVPSVDTAGWLDLVTTRQIIECEAFRQAVANPSAQWEDEIVSSYSLLAREIERIYDREMPTITPYWERHNQFHRALISSCPLKNLKGFVDDCYLRMSIYRRLTYTEGIPKDYVIQQHHNLMNVALGGDVEAAVEAMTAHIAGNAKIMLKILR